MNLRYKIACKFKLFGNGCYCGVLALLFILIVAFKPEKPEFSQRQVLFDNDWRFHLGDMSGAEKPTFDDKNWRTLDLPHDWSIEDLPANPGKKQIGPFSEDSPGKISTGHAMGGTGWYRKTFVLNSSSKGKQVQVYFDGVYMESDVYQLMTNEIIKEIEKNIRYQSAKSMDH